MTPKILLIISFLINAITFYFQLDPRNLYVAWGFAVGAAIVLMIERQDNQPGESTGIGYKAMGKIKSTFIYEVTFNSHPTIGKRFSTHKAKEAVGNEKWCAYGVIDGSMAQQFGTTEKQAIERLMKVFKSIR